MKKKYTNFMILFLSLFLINPAYALEKTTGRVSDYKGLRLRNAPNTSSEKIITIPHNEYITIVSQSEKNDACPDGWLEIIYDTDNKSYKGYVCSTYVSDIKTETIEEKQEEEKEEEIQEEPKEEEKQEKEKQEEEKQEEEKQEEEPVEETLSQKIAKMTDKEFEDYLISQGFPNDYIAKLKVVHKAHPTWVFKAVKAKYSWKETMDYQNTNGTSLLNVNATAVANGLEGLLSFKVPNYDYTLDKFTPYDGLYWFQASEKTIAYYIDPRNWLDEKSIFMFEDLSYNPEYQTEEVVKKVLYSDFLKQFSSLFMKAGKNNQVSPVYLAALSRQEVGTSSTNIVSNGKAGVLSDGVNYTGYYNFFNIGASSSADPKLKSLQYAKSMEWNTQEKSINGGSYTIAKNYIQCGQYTSYFQKYNVAPTATKGMWHQYSTNVQGCVSPAGTTYNSYANMGILDEGITFIIPVFEGMPTSTSLPNYGNPNNLLSDIKINGSTITKFSSSTFKYSITVPYSETITINGTVFNSKATASGFGTKELKDGVNTFTIKVTAQNGDIRNYTLNITREAKVEPKPTPTPTPTPTSEPVNPAPKPKEEPKEEPPKIEVKEVLAKSGYSNDGTYLWNIPIATTVDTFIKNFIKNYPTVSVNVKDKNNKLKSSGIIGTGDKLVISIDGKDTELLIVIYGDINGDGNISAIDLLNVQKHILGYTKLLNSYLKAADVNKDGKVSAIDLLNVQKHILKYTNISQK